VAGYSAAAGHGGFGQAQESQQEHILFQAIRRGDTELLS
jgi:hypothetical protein